MCGRSIFLEFCTFSIPHRIGKLKEQSVVSFKEQTINKSYDQW